jgi:hypothetical protein
MIVYKIIVGIVHLQVYLIINSMHLLSRGQFMRAY